MLNSRFQDWHKAFTTTDFFAKKDELVGIISASVGLCAVALCVTELMPSKRIGENITIPAKGSRQAVHNETATLPTATNKRKNANVDAQSICARDINTNTQAVLVNSPASRKSLIAHVEDIYKVPNALAQKIVHTTLTVSKENNMDPFLALGIIAKESSFNHKAKSSYGAAGLMQIHAPSHLALLQQIGLKELNPKDVQQALTTKVKLNVTAGIKIYKAYEKQYGSSIKALQAYNGAKQDTSYRYAKKVLAMREDFKKMALQNLSCAASDSSA